MLIAAYFSRPVFNGVIISLPTFEERLGETGVGLFAVGSYSAFVSAVAASA